MGNRTTDLLHDLDAVSSALVQGRLSDLPALAERIAVAETVLLRVGGDRSDLQAVVASAQRAARLIEESRKGIASALETLAMAKAPAPEFRPYGADGRRVNAPKASATRRA